MRQRRRIVERVTPRVSKGPVARLEVGGAYRSRKGSWLRVQFGREVVYVVISCPPELTQLSSVTILTPKGIAMCSPFDLRPVDDVEL